jgi:hypothetical protein
MCQVCESAAYELPKTSHRSRISKLTDRIADENQQNAQLIYIFSICSTYMFRSCLTIIRVRCHRVSNTAICAFVQDVIVYKYNNPNFVWYVDN